MRFSVSSFAREDGGDVYVFLENSEFYGSGTGDIRGWGTSTFAELRVLPDAAMSETPWYGEPGGTRADGDVLYTVLESGGDGMTFLMEDGWLAENGEPLRAVCLARQDGADLVWIALRTVSTQIDYRMTDTNERDNDAAPTYLDYDPAADPALRVRLCASAKEFMDGHVTLLQGLSGSELASVLPERVTVPGDGKGRSFSVPCTDLTEFGSDESGQYLRFRGTDADGDAVQYTLRNGGLLLVNGQTAEYDAWSEAYKAGKAEPDPAMSALLGTDAVAWGDGWLTDPGAFIYRMLSEENYCYLTAER